MLQSGFSCNCGFTCESADPKLVDHMEQCLSYPFQSDICQMMEQKQFWTYNMEELLILRADLSLQIRRVDNTLMIINPPNIRQQSSDAKQACKFCLTDFQINKDFDKIWFLEKCGDMICRICFNKEVIQKFNVGLKCKCGTPFTSQDIIQVIGQDRYTKLENDLNMSNQNLITCASCEQIHYFEMGKADDLIKDQDGKVIQGAQLIHYIQNRFKCSKCNVEQCKSCKVIPYHTNMTCDEAKVRKESKKCRLCDNPTEIDDKQIEAYRQICKTAECQQRLKTLCNKKLKCGHFCQGGLNEPCLPCLNEACAKDQNEDDYCNICFTEALKSQACSISSTCGHIFHEYCITTKLVTRYNGPRIVFNFLMCPLCKQYLKIPKLQKQIDQGNALLKEIQGLVMERLKLEDRLKDKELLDKNHQYYQKPLEYGMHIYCYYECFKCKKPYFGGLQNCQAAAEQDNKVEFKKEDLVCTKCCPIISFEDKCKTHGADYIDFKCRFCCSLALWFCHGTTHYCDPCHSNIKPKMEKPCPGPGKCPLGMDHKPNGQEMALGCSICRAERLKKV